MKGRIRIALAVALVGGSAVEARAQHPRQTPVVEAIEKTRRGIVTLRATGSSEWGKRSLVGTGVIVDERGYVVTNHHVVADATKVTATLWDKTTLEARVHTEDPRHDLAVLRLVVKRNVKALSFGPGGDLMVGETVIAIGNPFGYANTVSTGIISALGREVTMPSGETLRGLIQTNASINPGNSGGPLVNVNGELIGITVALRQDAQNIAFALNAETVKDVLAKHLSSLEVSKVAHGLVCKEKVAPEGKARQRVVVEKVSRASGSLRNGDVLLRLGSLEVRNRFDVERALWGYEPGDKVKAVVLRRGKRKKASLKLTGAETPGVTAAGGRAR
jgi:serine protease Do